MFVPFEFLNIFIINDITKLKKSGIAARSQSLDNVRTWTKNDVRSWFREYGASEEVVEKALFAGVIDGPSFSSE